jgi:hypothetical protein
MITDRPKYLVDQDDYKKLPGKPFSVHFDALPELVRHALGPLGGIQPITGEMAKAANGKLYDTPSDGEVKLFQKIGTVFQPIFVVLNIAHLRDADDAVVAMPYALSLMPTSKRGLLDEKDIELVAKLDVQKLVNESELCYANFDPFTGDRGLFGSLKVFLGENLIQCFLDELGIVVGQYFLAKTYDPDDVIEAAMGFPSTKAEEKYRKHRANLLYKPFTEIKPRRVWGAQSPIELFLFQELLRHGLSPLLQVLVFEDGSVHPSLYDLWRDIDFRYAPSLITEPDMYFPDKKVAVFCDSTRHHRGARAKEKDAAIDAKLQGVGISSVRVPGKLIVEDVKEAADLVSKALGYENGISCCRSPPQR